MIVSTSDYWSQIQDYLTDVTPQRHSTLVEMEAYAKERSFPIIGPLVGRLLYQMARLSNASRILELGSGFGYSAFWFSLAMGESLSITLTDGDPDNRTRALEYFRRGELTSTFDYRVGDALTIAESLSGPFDVVLNDIDKHQYPETIDTAARLLRPGGLFITDNIIWSGRILDDNVDDTTAAIMTFTRQMYADTRFFPTIVPLRDGVLVALRN